MKQASPCNIQIVTFSKHHEQQVIDLIIDIQSKEFKVEITAADQPDLKDINAYYQRDDGNFWVALWDEKVLGTISLSDIGNKQVALRKMFVKQGFRGQPLFIGQKLLDTAVEWSKDRRIQQIFLGTVPNYYAAHKFYEKNNFVKINESQLPSTFNIMAVDKYFYCLQL
ncbi:MAG: GNAT family N-acetyltransferase [Alcanivoracaceae bacterium]|nr:GNAT family N-acetyltransferase [Alcanivoracaceae bacterium]